MAKQKKQSGEHTTPRRTVQFPGDWHDWMQALAAKRPIPVMWLIVEVMAQYGAAQGMPDHPVFPWLAPKVPRVRKRRKGAG